MDCTHLPNSRLASPLHVGVKAPAVLAVVGRTAKAALALVGAIAVRLAFVAVIVAFIAAMIWAYQGDDSATANPWTPSSATLIVEGK